jgi:hypothetical protein
MRKLAMIRKNDEDGCPFGLSIPHACQSAGDSVNKLAPLDSLGPDASEEEKGKIKEANERVYMHICPGTECKYAGAVIPQNNCVECSYGDTAPGSKETKALQGSPFYSQMFAGIGLDGVFSYPLGYYSEMNTGRNAYYGLYSMNDFRDIKLRKLANEVFEMIIAERKK